MDGIVPFDSANFDPDKVLWQAGDLLGTTSQGYVFVEEDMYAPYFKTTLFMQEHSTMTTSYVQTGGQAIAATSNQVELALSLIHISASQQSPAGGRAARLERLAAWWQ